MIHPDQWKDALMGGLPGEEAQLEMAPGSREWFRHTSEPVPAAVMVLLYPIPPQTGLVFIRRNKGGGHHSAQVSFPGGVREPGDMSLEATALRETREELGLEEPIRILGRLTDLYIPVSNFHVTPFVGWMERRPDFQPDPVEVAYVIEASLEELLRPSSRSSEMMEHQGRSFRAPCFRAGEDRIWGATAMMLGEFLRLAARLPAHRC